MKYKPTVLSKSEENFCETAGVIGCLIAIACFVQYLIIMESGWINFLILLAFCLSATSFVCLSQKRIQTGVLLIVSSALIVAVEMLLFLDRAFSLIILLLLLYSVFLTIWYWSSDLYRGIRGIHLMKKADEEQWQGKV